MVNALCHTLVLAKWCPSTSGTDLNLHEYSAPDVHKTSSPCTNRFYWLFCPYFWFSTSLKDISYHYIRVWIFHLTSLWDWVSLGSLIVQHISAPCFHRFTLGCYVFLSSNCFFHDQRDILLIVKEMFISVHLPTVPSCNHPFPLHHLFVYFKRALSLFLVTSPVFWAEQWV